MAEGTQKFCLQWNEFRGIVTSEFYNLRQDEDFVDVTLCCEGKQIKAHRMMLSACSPYFKNVLKGNPCQHPVFFLKDVSYSDLAAVVEFVYTGEVNVSQSNLSSFLKTAEMLQVKGLANDDKEKSGPSSQRTKSPAHPATPAAPSPAQSSPLPTKRQVSSETPSSPSVTKRGRVDPASGSRVLQSPAGAIPAEQSGAYQARWAAAHQPETTHHPPPPPPPAAANTAGHETVTVKTEMGAPEDGHSMESAVDAEADYSSLMDFKMAEQAVAAAGVEEGAGSQSGAFFGENASGDRDVGNRIWTEAIAGDGDQRREARCHLCGKTYSHRESLNQHLHLHRGLTVCLVCGETLATRKSLKVHMNGVHGVDLDGRPIRWKKR